MSIGYTGTNLRDTGSPKGCLHAVPYTQNKTSSGEESQGQGSNSTRRKGCRERRPKPPLAPILHPLSLYVRPGSTPARGGRLLCRPRSGPIQEPPWYLVSAGRGKTHAQCSLYQDEVSKPFLQGEVALHSHASPPPRDREPPTGIPYRIPPPTIPTPPLTRWRREHFRRVSLRVRPGGCCKCHSAGSSLCCTDYSGDGGQTVWLEPGGSSPALSWCEPDGDATYPGPASAFRYLGNERWGRQGLASARRAPACGWRDGRGFAGVWGLEEEEKLV